MQTATNGYHQQAPVHLERAELVKRRKVAVACDECRERKRKCDGVRPQCGPCTRRTPPLPCVWSEERSKYRSYIESLESRIRQLESHKTEDSPSPSAMRDHMSVHSGFGLATPETQSLSHGGGGDRRPNGHHVRGSLEGSRSPQAYVSANGDDDAQDSEDAGVDASSAYIEQGEQPGSNYFGPSSTSSFLGVVRLVIGKSSKSFSSAAPLPPPSREASERPTRPRKAAPSLQELGKTYDSTAFHVPPRREADALVTNYWTWIYTLYPVIHRPTFNEKYQALWEQSHHQFHPSTMTLDDVIFHCLLNGVFALGAHFQNEIDLGSRSSKSESFFNRCQQLLTIDLLGHGTFEMVQALLLMAQYLQSTDKPNHCWNLAGLAIRMAQAVGLHLEPAEGRASTGAHFDQVDIELRRRVWAGCILLDRVLSMTYGRPLMMHPPLTRHTMVVPSAIDDEFLTRHPNPPGTQPEGLPSIIASFSHTTTLQEILGEILSAFYQVNQSSSPFVASSERGTGQASESTHASLIGRLRDGDFQDVFRLDAKLSRWYDALPGYLKVEEGDVIRGSDSYLPLPAILSRQANSLRARWLHLRLFLSRPALIIILDRDQHSFTFDTNGEIGSCTSILKKKTLYNLAYLCIETAEELLSLIYSHRAAEQSSLPAWWLSVFYLHNCAIVMMIALQCPSLHDLRTEASLKESWVKCLKCLEDYKQYSEGARRSHRVLQMIDGQIFGEKYDRRHPSRGIVKSLATSPKAESNGTRSNSFGTGTGNGHSSGNTNINGHSNTNTNINGNGGLIIPPAGPMNRNTNTNGYTSDPFNQYDWSAGMDAVTNMPAIPDGDFWMGDAGDVSWLSTMPFVPGTGTYSSW